jgi:phenylalanyl-tRNA synthetase beta chain
VRTSREIEIARILCGCLTGLGISEIISYSLLSKKAVTIAGYALDGIVEIRNPLSTEQEVMRPGLMPGMLGSILWNLNRKIKDLKFFELGNVYEKTGIDAFREKKHLCIGMTGHASAGWSARETSVGFFDLKGALETVFSELGVEGISFRCVKDSRFSSSECAAIEMSGRTVGIMGLVDDKVLDGFDIKERVYLLEIDEDARLEKHFVRLPKYPSVFRDISIVVDIGASNADIIEAIKAAAQPLLKEAKLIDKYTGRQIPDGKTGLTYRLEYQDPARTLEEKDILEIHSNVLRSLEEKFGAKLR